VDNAWKSIYLSIPQKTGAIDQAPPFPPQTAGYALTRHFKSSDALSPRYSAITEDDDRIFWLVRAIGVKAAERQWDSNTAIPNNP
jgi:hypothetical protein